MVIDTSAVIAILLGEPEAHSLASAIAGDPKRLIAAVSLLESAIVIEARKGPTAARELDLLLHTARIEPVGMDVDQVAAARRAYQRFGRGQHSAQLNLGDCCAYALAACSGESLLFKGDDFFKTDVAVAPWQA